MVLSFGLASCSFNEDSNKAADTSSVTDTSQAQSPSEHLTDTDVTVDHGYVKSKTPNKDMTAVFGTLTNHTDKEKNLESVSSVDLRGHFQLHAVVDGKMSEKKGGFTLPANGSFELKPGGEHIMIMGNHDELAAGDHVILELKFKDGSVSKVTVPVREQPSGEEDYDGNNASPTPATMSDSLRPSDSHSNEHSNH
ncbi:copper chaperone PCu(A)C [Corynebacterium kroppenstedtii]|uniref:copper chaperone PCu(A)C n=1 Tax=Corynebacterium sp. PCR 32 TaxID=3351342 RepID=UPI00309B7207